MPFRTFSNLVCETDALTGADGAPWIITKKRFNYFSVGILDVFLSTAIKTASIVFMFPFLNF